jgi:hypothetical protein
MTTTNPVTHRAARFMLLAVPALLLIAALAPAPAAAQEECLIDQQGADDEPGQKDLNEFCEETGDNSSPFDLHISWNFDDTAWSGTNTGDACALFDTDGDTFANYALCVTLYDGPPAKQLGVCEGTSNQQCSTDTECGDDGLTPCVAVSPRLYECGDDRVDRCTNSEQHGVCSGNPGICGVTGETCSSDEECPQDFASECVANPGTCSNDSSIFCERNGDCGTGNTCDGSGTQDDDPFQPNVCDTDLGRCIADGEVCTSDVDCAQNVHTGSNVCNGTNCETEDAHVICW